MSEPTTPLPSLTEGEAALAGLIGLLGAAAAVAAVEVYGVWGPRKGDTYTELWRYAYRRAPRAGRVAMVGSLTAVLGWLWHHLVLGEAHGER